MARAAETIKRVLVEGKARTNAVRKALKDIRSESERLGREAAKVSGRMGQMGKSVDSAANNLSAMRQTIGRVTKVLGAAGLIGLMLKAVDVTDKLAARSLELQNVSKNLAISIDGARKATRGAVDDFQLMKAANNAVSLQVVQSGEEFTALADAATKLGARVGRTAEESLADLVTALGRASPLILDNLGVTVKVGEAQRRYAAQLGKTVEQLTEDEKAQAFRIVAMERILEVSKDVELANDGAAGSWQRAKTAVKNFGDAILGAEPDIGKAREAVGKLDEQTLEAAKTMDTFGASRDIVVRALRDMGLSADETGIAIDALRKKMRRLMQTQEEMALQRAEAEGQKVFDEQMQRSQARIRDAERQIAMLEAVGAAEKRAAEVAELRTFIINEQAFIAEKNADFAKAEELRFKAEIAAISAVTEADQRRAKAGQSAAQAAEKARREFEAFLNSIDKGVEKILQMEEASKEAFAVFRKDILGINVVDPFGEDVLQEQLDNVIDFERAKSQIQLNERLRAVEAQRAAGVEPLQLIEMEASARSAFIEQEIERLKREKSFSEEAIQIQALRDEQEQVFHEARLARMAEERRQLEATARKHQEIARMVISAGESQAQSLSSSLISIKDSARSAQVAAIAHGKSQQEAALAAKAAALEGQKGFAFGIRNQMITLGVSLLAKAVADFVSLNIPGGAAKTAAAGVAFGAAALAGRAARGLEVRAAQAQASAAGGGSGVGGFGAGGQFGTVPSESQSSTQGFRRGEIPDSDLFRRDPTAAESINAPIGPPPGGGGTSGGNVTNITINGFVGGEADVGRAVRRALRADELKNGAPRRTGS